MATKRRRRETPEEQLPPFNREQVRAAAQSGAPLERIAVAMGVDYPKLKKIHKELFNSDYDRGLSMGVQNVFTGVNQAAVEGDMKAAQMFLDYTGIQPVSTTTGSSSKSNGEQRRRRLIVETVELELDEDE